MSERDERRAWLEREAERTPDGWEATFIDTFGIEGAVDLLTVQDGGVMSWHGLDLRRSPFRQDAELKFLVSEAREAVGAAVRRAYELAWERLRH